MAERFALIVSDACSSPTPSAAKMTPFYGWYVTAAAASIAFGAWGVAYYNLGVFLYTFHVDRGWSRSALAAGAALFSILAGLAGLSAGRMVDCRGARIVLVFGGLTIGAAMLGIGRVGELWQLYLFDALLAIGYGCTNVVVLSALVARWFVRRRALAMSLALSGASVGGLVLVPLSTTLIARFDIPTAATTLALVVWGIVLPAAIFIVRNQPADLGLCPDGDVAPATPAPSRSLDPPWTVRAALRTLTWWTLTIAFALTLLGQAAYLVHQVSFLSPKLGLAGAAVGVGITAIASIVGRFALGWLGDWAPTRRLAVGCCLLQGAAVLAAAHSDTPLVLYATAAAFGLTMGNVVALHPLMMAETFGVHSHGTVYGPGYLLTQLGQAGGPLLVGLLADLTAGYRLPFALTASAAIVAAGILALRTDPPHTHAVS